MFDSSRSKFHIVGFKWKISNNLIHVKGENVIYKDSHDWYHVFRSWTESNVIPSSAFVLPSLADVRRCTAADAQGSSREVPS